MTEVAYPLVYSKVLALATATLTTLRVTDGYDVSNEEGDVLMLGVPSLADVNAISAGSYAQDIATLGSSRPREENGTINGVVMAYVGESGDEGAGLARTAAFGYIAALNGALRTSPDLSTGLTYCFAQASAGEVLEDKEVGATCAVSIVISYRARI